MAKTLRSRIAAVAVAALGVGLLQAAPANAADQKATIDSISVGSSVAARVGAKMYLPITLRENGATLASGDTVALGAKFLLDGGRPTGDTTSLLYISTSSDTSTVATAATTLTTGEYVRFNTAGTSVTASQLVAFEAKTAGTYKILIWVDANADGDFDSGEKSASVTLATGGAPTSFTVTKVSPGTPSNSFATAKDSGTSGITWDAGAVYKVVPKDSAGNVARLTSDETFDLTSSSNKVTFRTYNSGSAVTSLGASDQEPDGSFYFITSTTHTADVTTVITVTGGGSLPSTLVRTISASSLVTDATDFDTAGNNSSTSVGTSGFGVTAGTDDTADISTGVSSITVKVVGAGSETVTAILVTDTKGVITGKAGAKFTMAAAAPESATDAASKSTFAITFAGIAKQAGDSFIIAFLDNDDGSAATLTFDAPDDATVSLTNDTVVAVAAGSITLTGTVKDEFAVAVANYNVSVTVSGRNTKAATNVLSDSSGVVTFTYTDSGTLSTADTVAFAGTATTNATVTWKALADFGVSTVTLEYPNEDDVIAGTTTTDINATAGGATGTVATVTATVKDVNGNVIQYVPVTFTVAGLTGAEILTTKATVYTNSEGKAATSVASYAEGKATVTATAAGVAKSADIYFKQADASEARTITAVVSGRSVTATVKDRYGNPIENVAVYATRTGGGYFGNGASSSSGETDKYGQIEFIVTPGATDTVVTVKFATASYGQSADAAGYVGGDADTGTAVTAAVAGTTLVAQKGLGSTLAPAGVNSATATVAKAAPDSTATDVAAVKAQVATLTTTITSIQTAISTLVASVTATLTSMSAQINKIMKKLKIK